MPGTASMSPVQIKGQAMSCLDHSYWDQLVLQPSSCATEGHTVRGRATTHECSGCMWHQALQPLLT